MSVLALLGFVAAVVAPVTALYLLLRWLLTRGRSRRNPRTIAEREQTQQPAAAARTEFWLR